ncbi:unnamed protein product, partial [Adineta steineri]
MQFEQLPNKILIECFQYLNAPDIFHSFDRLNYRLYILIRNIDLHLNCEQVKKSSFNEFCQTIRLNPEIKRNIIYLKLSNIDLRGQIESFFSLFALKIFINLRSLSFIDMHHDDTKQNYHTEQEREHEQVSSMLTLLPNLYRFYAPEWKLEAQAISKSKIQVLSLWKYDLTFLCEISSVISLRIRFCTARELRAILNYTPMLKYIKIDRLSPFQTDFWHQHNWYINYVVDNEFTSVYTIPYSFTHYTLTPTMKKYNSPSTNGV